MYHIFKNIIDMTKSKFLSNLCLVVFPVLITLFKLSSKYEFGCTQIEFLMDDTNAVLYLFQVK
jgi:hypothetical protein